MRERIWAASFAPPTGEKTGGFPPVFIQFWAEKVKNETIQRVCREITDAVANAVAAMNQTYVNDLKASGSFDKDAQAKALNGAISAAIKSLSKDALDYIKEISGDDTVGYLTTRIQAQIDLNKAAKAAQQ